MTKESKENPPKTAKRGKSYLMHMVSKSPKTEFQIRQKLKQTDYSSTIIDEVISFGKFYQYINDEAYTQQWLKCQVDIKQFGKFRCIQELKKKGVSIEIIEPLVDQFFSGHEDYERELATAFLLKKKHQIKGKDFYHKKQKAYRILYQRGFSSDIIQSTLTDFFSTSDDY